jgi:molybdenum cofactor cytidylyltransferase
MKVGAIVLAAGASYRMGSPKALLEIGEETFLRRVVGTMQHVGAADIAVVLGADADRIKSTLGWFTGVLTINQNWQNGQISSIIAGLDALSGLGLDAVLVHPVDRPLVSGGTVLALIKAAASGEGSIVVPLYQGRRGHPALFDSAHFNNLRSAPADIGARHLLRTNPNSLLEVPVDDEGVIINIDTPEQYAAYVQTRRV